MKPLFRSTIDFYRDLGYSEKTMGCLAYLESRCEKLREYLEDYRHLQPDGKPFSEGILGLIKELHELREDFYKLSGEIFNLKCRAPEIDSNFICDDLDNDSF